jgi:hypothetical protein
MTKATSNGRNTTREIGEIKATVSWTWTKTGFLLEHKMFNKQPGQKNELMMVSKG